ncbi:MAG: DUF4403 family protein [Pseudolabrys sp.]|nr:DUF4403 family protein [Pseudolabrys sp.]
MTLDYRTILGGIGIVAVFFAVTLWILNTFSATPKISPPLAELPPLKDESRPSFVVAPVAIALTAIRSSLDAAAPREFAGKNNNPVTQLLGKAEIGLTLGRGPLAVTGRSEGLTVNVPLTGSVHITGEVGNVAGKTVGGIGGAIGGLLGGNVGKQIESLANKVFDQRTDIRGNVAMTSRPALTRAWRLEPNLAAQVNLGDTALNIAGLKINVGQEIRPLLDPLVNEQVGALQARLRNDPMIETAARREWQKMCRSIPLGGGKTGLPALWLEFKPVRAYAAQPKIDNKDVTLTIGVQSDTRIVPSETKPSCPFPIQLELVPPIDQGRLAFAVPIDMPFTALNALLEAQIKGQKFPKDATASPVEVEVRKAEVAAAGDRLLISLLVKAIERKSWFGFGAEATVHVWGKPVLDQQQQILRLTDLSLAVESEAAFGLLGAAARAAVPYLQDALAKNAVIDLKPFAADARAKIALAAADFRQVTPGVSVDTAITDLRLIGIEFDSRTMRVVTEAQGTAKVAVTELPK